MTEIDCTAARDELADLARRGPEGEERAEVRAHLSRCPACRDELLVLRRLLAARPTAPAHLEARIREAVAGEARPGSPDRRSGREGGAGAGWRRRWRRWSTPAAAAAALVVAGGLLLDHAGPERARDATDPMETAAGALWPSDDGALAGAPLLDDLSEEDLLTILEEMGG